MIERERKGCSEGAMAKESTSLLREETLDEDNKRIGVYTPCHSMKWSTEQLYGQSVLSLYREAIKVAS